MELLLVRHGETDANANGIVQGWLDTELNDKGKEQVQDAAARFNENIDVIYCSDLKRASQTAVMFREKYPAVPYFEDKRLRERGFGDAEGVHRDKHDWEVFWASDDKVSIPNSETLKDFNQRVSSFIDMLNETEYSKVLVVTHGGTVNRFQYLTSTSHQRKRPENASITRVVI